jgi:hypothetical protein
VYYSLVVEKYQHSRFEMNLVGLGRYYGFLQQGKRSLGILVQTNHVFPMNRKMKRKAL